MMRQLGLLFGGWWRGSACHSRAARLV